MIVGFLNMEGIGELFFLLVVMVVVFVVGEEIIFRGIV